MPSRRTLIASGIALIAAAGLGTWYALGRATPLTRDVDVLLAEHAVPVMAQPPTDTTNLTLGHGAAGALLAGGYTIHPELADTGHGRRPAISPGA